VDKALKETERGEKRLGTRTKTRGSKGYVAISADLEREIRGWIEFASLGPDDFLFPSEAGTPFQIRNYLKRIPKPLAARAGITDMTHSSMRMTNWYQKKIPEAVREAVESMGWGTVAGDESGKAHPMNGEIDFDGFFQR
jgi:hypothetical protein